MNKIILLLIILLSYNISKSQVSFPSSPRYDLMIVNIDTNGFRINERTIYYALVNKTSMNAAKWCEKMQDTTTGYYICELPSPDRIVAIGIIPSILPYMQAIVEDVSTLEYNKTQMLTLNIPPEWRDIVSKIFLIDRNNLIKIE